MPVRRFTPQDKLHVLTLLKNGASKKSIARLLQIDRRDITVWDLRYQRYGAEGLEPTFKRTISPDLKRQMIDEYQAGGISTRELCAKYNVCLSSFKNWRRQYQAESTNNLK
ncbi:MAG: helix-turn-helix domain-containing protein [Bacteroidaceae bacterium]|nr:helix-turn-helix domain-containing protein [Bacteroidaceae bacterium]